MLKKIIATLLLLTVSLAVGAPFGTQVFAQKQNTAPKKMNVLFIALDDLNVALSVYGNKQVISPNVERLAKRSVRFDRAYTQYPLCNPSRVSLFSGYRPEVTGVLNNYTPPRKNIGEATLLPEYFRQNGYFTARQGKMMHALYENAVRWDVAQPEQRPLNEREKSVFAGKDSQPPKNKANAEPKNESNGGEERQDAVTAKKPTTTKVVDRGEGLSWEMLDMPPENTADGRSVTRSIENINQAVKENKPFFVGVGFTKPHLAWNVPKKYFDLYDVSKIELPATDKGDRLGKPPLAFTTTIGAENMTDEKRREAIRAYYACVSFDDDQLGRLLKTMDDNNLWENTIVVFWGDHGFHLGDHDLWRKMTLFERGTRVPLMIAAPGIKGGTSSPRVVELLDLYPTLAELAGLPAPTDKQGKSLVPLLKDPTRRWDHAAYTVVERENLLGRSVRDERYRYTEWGENGSEGAELYDYETDPNEFNNLVKDAKQNAVVKRMKGLLDQQKQKDEAFRKSKFGKN